MFPKRDSQLARIFQNCFLAGEGERDLAVCSWLCVPLPPLGLPGLLREVLIVKCDKLLQLCLALCDPVVFSSCCASVGFLTRYDGEFINGCR